MSVQHILDRLFSLHRFGIKPGLERIQRILELCGSPERNLPAIHVAGTNGKGSVSSMCSAILQEAGYSVGLYTSPHIRRFNERIQVDGVCISDVDIVRLYGENESIFIQTEATFFECTTALALLYFAEKKPDWIVMETGMGGRYDATNVLDTRVSVITSIDFDHQEYLGETIAKIAWEKAGIIKKGIPLVVADLASEAMEVVKSVADDLSAPLVLANQKHSVESLNIDENFAMKVRWTTHEGSSTELTSSLSGAHQCSNLACVLSCLDFVMPDKKLSAETIQRGLNNLGQRTHLHGRVEIVSQDPLILCDVGHNPACLRATVDTILRSPFSGQKFDIVFGAMADKDVHEMLEILKPICNCIYAGTAATERAMKAANIVELALGLGLNAIDCDTIAGALNKTLEAGQAILGIGSFYVIDEIMVELSRQGLLEI